VQFSLQPGVFGGARVQLLLKLGDSSPKVSRHILGKRGHVLKLMSLRTHVAHAR
jgi:hypothetical protein